MAPRTRRPEGPDGVDGFATTEIRWFATGPLPTAVRTWFAAGPTLLETRSDRYRLDGSPDIGLKSRDQGHLEVKLRRPSAAMVDFGGGLAGRLEEWVKVEEVDAADYPTARPGDWVDVNKLVLTRTYVAIGESTVAVTSRRALESSGCDVEIADVTVGDIRAWTLGLEAWGPAGQRAELLGGAFADVSGAGPLPAELSTELGPAMGYPEWLGTLDLTRFTGER